MNEATPDGDKCVEAVDAVSALQMLDIGKHIRAGYLNVYGRVLAVSEIIPIKQSKLFMVKLLPAVNIICREDELLSYRDTVTPDCSYVFTNLRRCTVSQRSSCQIQSYIFTKKTVVLPEGSVNLKVLTAHDWFRRRGKDVQIQEVSNAPPEEFDSYAGTVTAVLDDQVGVFELDKEIRLYLGMIPALHMFRNLYRGVQIQVSNVHRRLSTQEPKVSLYGCMMTSIKIIKGREFKRRTVKTPELLERYLNLYKMSQKKLDYLFNLSTKLKRWSLGEMRCYDRLMTTILSTKELSWEQDKTCRNYVDEFVFYPHRCCVKEDSQEISRFVFADSVFKTDTPDKTFTHRCVQSDQILFGELDLCYQTGQSMLKDTSGCVNTLVTCYTVNAQQSRPSTYRDANHQCDSSCDCRDLAPGQRFKCPYLHTCCVGKVVAVTRYGVCDNGSENIDRTRYVVFSLKDAVYLGKKKTTPSGQVNEQSSVAYTDSNENTVTVVEHVEGTHGKSKIPEAVIIGEPTVGACEKSKHAEALWETEFESSSETAIVLICRKEALMMEGNTSRFCCQGTNPTKVGSRTKVTISFHGKASLWYSVIYPGCTYKFSVPKDMSPLFGNRGREKIKKISGYLVVNEDVELEQIYPQPPAALSSWMMGDKQLTSIFSSVYRDTRGVVISATMLKDRDGRTGGNVCSAIKLKCEDEDIIQIYLKPNNLCLPLGLVAGSAVSFTQIERKISQAGNIYWRFIPMSSVTVLAFRQTSPDGTEENLTNNMSFPNGYLCDVFNKEKETANIFIQNCQVNKVLRVSLKVICGRCSSMMIKSTCSNTGCLNTEPGKFVARATVLVEDATDFAMVTLNGEKVRELLLIPVSAWQDFQREANNIGEIFIIPAGPQIRNDIEGILYTFCCTKRIKGTWTMKLRVRPESNGTNLDNIPAQKFTEKLIGTVTTNVVTRCTPFLQLECLHLQKHDPSQTCNDLLVTNSSFLNEI